jgi:anti-sigma regulatory factor (Ser/Thr protein kinase)
MGKLYLWGFGDQNSQIEPLKQDFDIPIKYFSLWKDNCVIVDETGRVLTLDEQVYKSALDIECHFSLRVEGRTISKVSTGNKFFMCLPHRPLIRQPSTPNMADNYTLKTRTPNYLDGDPHSDNNNFAQTRQFSRESPDKEIIVNMDKTQLIRIVTNLIQNAMHATEEIEDPRITLTVSESELAIELLVVDNGKGIVEALKSKVFEPRFTTKSSGMGLGLPMVKKIIEGYGGAISFQSQEEVGTQFIVHIPKGNRTDA